MTVSVAQAQLFFLALTRVLAMIVQVPVLGGRFIPTPVKLGLGMTLAILLVAWDPLPVGSPALSLFPFALGIGRELLIGTLAGFGATLVFGAAQMAGDVLGIGAGFGAGQVLNPAFDGSGSVLEQFTLMLSVLLFLVLDGHHVFLMAVQRTFEVIPPGAGLPDVTSQPLVTLSARLITAGVQMALPVLGAVLLTDIVLALLARVAPQVHVFFLGAPLKVGVGLLALALALSALASTLSGLIRQLGGYTLSLLGA